MVGVPSEEIKFLCLFPLASCVTDMLKGQTTILFSILVTDTNCCLHLGFNLLELQTTGIQDFFASELSVTQKQIIILFKE